MAKKFCRLLFVAVAFVSTFSALNYRSYAQSSDQNLPTPVLSNDINGKITALDLGDPRLTKHFYAFEANPGDLLITVESRNLNGDVDVFTAVTFRPLMKTTMIATSQSSEVTKGIYLRAHQILILRVEARTPSDEPGTYRIHFGGTFAPFSGGIPVAENSPAEPTTEKSDANRLSSVGATIPRPVEEAVAEPKPSPEKTEEKPAAETAKPTTEKRTTTSRRTTPRNPRRTTRPAPAKPAPAKKTESTETEAAKTDAKKEEEKPAVVSEKPTETTAPSSEKAKTQEVAPAGAHLIIEEKDGTRIDRPMSTIRRVVIEGPAIVIVLKTGKIERIPMADVARMSIEPQQ